MVRLEKWGKDLGFRNFDGIVSPSCFELIARTHAKLLDFFRSKLSSSFRDQIFSLSSDLDKEYTKLNVGKVVDKMARESCIPSDSVKNKDDYSNLIHNIGTKAYIDSDKTNPAYLVG